MPPTLMELLEDEVYSRYFSRNPILPALASAEPWRLMARRSPDDPRSTWAIKDFASFADARRRALRVVGSENYVDAAVVSRVTFFRPPLDFTWNERKFRWCGRCRRPTLFREMTGHQALRGAAVVDGDPISRCYYCGVRETMMPRYRPRVRGQVAT